MNMDKQIIYEELRTIPISSLSEDQIKGSFPASALRWMDEKDEVLKLKEEIKDLEEQYVEMESQKEELAGLICEGTHQDLKDWADSFAGHAECECFIEFEKLKKENEKLKALAALGAEGILKFHGVS